MEVAESAGATAAIPPGCDADCEAAELSVTGFAPLVLAAIAIESPFWLGCRRNGGSCAAAGVATDPVAWSASAVAGGAVAAGGCWGPPCCGSPAGAATSAEVGPSSSAGKVMPACMHTSRRPREVASASCIVTGDDTGHSAAPPIRYKPSLLCSLPFKRLSNRASIGHVMP